MSSLQATKPGPGDAIQVGRQAIFDRDLKVFAYELLYRDAGGGCDITDGDRASSVTLLNAFMEIGIDRLTGPHRAFINLTRAFFVDLPALPFDPQRVVLEVLEDVQVDDALLRGLENMTAAGFVLALDDYLFQPQLAPILPLVRYIKVEIRPDGLDELARRMPELRATGALLLAEKVETEEQFRRLRDMGFDYFQGYFFARPSTVSSRRVEENAAMVTRLLARLNDPAAPLSEIVDLVCRDPGLSFKILRYVNSAGVGLRARVESIQHAVVLMGLARIRAWATLFAMAGLDNRPTEILNVGLLRAHLCERLARLCGDATPATAYTVGLLSILDAMLGRPIAELVDQLPLPDEVRRGIIACEGPYGELLRMAIALERHEPPGSACTRLPAAALVEAYAASSAAAFEAMQFIDHA